MGGRDDDDNNKIKFHVYSTTTAEHLQYMKEFFMKYNNITWNSLMYEIFGNSNVENKIPVHYIGSRRHPVLLRSTMGEFCQFVEFVLAKSKAKENIELTVQWNSRKNVSAAASCEMDRNVDVKRMNVSNEDLRETPEMRLDDFLPIFNCGIDEKMKPDIEKEINKYSCSIFQGSAGLLETDTTTAFPEKGTLRMKRIDASAIGNLLKEDKVLLLPTVNNQYLMINFNKQHPSSNAGVINLQWQKQDPYSKYECAEINLSSVITNGSLNYTLGCDADFVKCFELFMESFQTNAKDRREEPTCRPADGAQKGSTVGRNILKPDAHVHQKHFEEYLEKFKTHVMSDVRRMIEGMLKNNEMEATVVSASACNNNATLSAATIASPALEASSSSTPAVPRGELKAQESDKDTESLSPCFGNLHLEEKHGSATMSCSRSRNGGEVQGLSKKATINILKKREHGKMLELASDLFVISKSGFKMKMPRNATTNTRLILVRYEKYRNSREEPELQLQAVADGVECCIKPVTKNMEKLHPRDRSSYTYYDVRVKSKDKSGRFRLYFVVTHSEKALGHSFRIDVRVRRVYTLFNAPAVDEVLTEKNGRINNTPLLMNEEIWSQKHRELLSNRGDGGGGGDLRLPRIDAEEITNMYPPFSDSDDTDADIEAKMERNAKDNRGDDNYHSNVINEMANDDSDSDSDSSLSLLLDEYEVREKLADDDDEEEEEGDDDYYHHHHHHDDHRHYHHHNDIVNLPSCFIPNAGIESQKDTIPIRVKRKTSEAKRTSDMNKLKSTRVLANSQNSADEEQQNELSATSHFTTPMNGSSAYPNLSGLKEFINPAAPEKKKNAIEGRSKDADVNATNGKSASSSSTSKVPSSPSVVNILPDTVFQTASNVLKSVLNTHTASNINNYLGSVNGSVSSFLENSAPFIPDPFSKMTAAAAAAAAAADPTSCSSTSASSSSSGRKCCTVKFGTAEEKAKDSNDGTIKDTQSKSPSNSSINAEEEQNSRENLRKEMKEHLQKLNEMGFLNDAYNSYLLKQYPNNLDKVVESLINYSAP